MAPAEASTSANPRKRKQPQPPFNPPRPKTNSAGVTKSTASKKKNNVGSIFNDGAKKSRGQPKPKPTKVKAAKPSRKGKQKQRPGVKEAEPEDEEDDDDDEEGAGQILLDSSADSEDSSESPEEEDAENASDLDADMMLAEISHDVAAEADTGEPAVPIHLIHRLLQHSFQQPDTTKLGNDARACVGKYIETFVREGIARCAFEVTEKGTTRPVGSDSAIGMDDGWLEVEDLESVASQLVYDF